MKVVLFCGGLGMRIRDAGENVPKPMVTIGYRPILWHVMKYYAHFGHKDFILCLGYKGEVIKDYFRNYHWNTSDVTLRLGRTPKITYHSQHEAEDWTVTLLDTGQSTQTGGRLRRARTRPQPADHSDHMDRLSGRKRPARRRAPRLSPAPNQCDSFLIAFSRILRSAREARRSDIARTTLLRST